MKRFLLTGLAMLLTGCSNTLPCFNPEAGIFSEYRAIQQEYISSGSSPASPVGKYE